MSYEKLGTILDRIRAIQITDYVLYYDPRGDDDMRDTSYVVHRYGDSPYAIETATEYYRPASMHHDVDWQLRGYRQTVVTDLVRHAGQPGIWRHRPVKHEEVRMYGLDWDKPWEGNANAVNGAHDRIMAFLKNCAVRWDGPCSIPQIVRPEPVPQTVLLTPGARRIRI